MAIRKNLDETEQELLLMAIAEIRQKIYSKAKEILVPFKLPQILREVKFSVPIKGDKSKLLGLSHRNAVYFRMEKEKQATLIHPVHHADRVLNTLKQDLQLKELPQRIECFDNSNLQGNFPVAACVVFVKGKPAKREYRHFNVKSVEGPDDYASMEEIVTRRYKRQQEEMKPLPQLIVIDGGKGQLSAAVHALEGLGLRGEITVIGIAKKLEEIYFPGDTIPIYLDKKSESLKLLQQLRDEAHRFGITFHRNKRSAGFAVTELEQIKGIGKETSQKLLTKYKSVKNLLVLSYEELKKEVGNSKAALIRDYFRQKGEIHPE